MRWPLCCIKYDDPGGGSRRMIAKGGVRVIEFHWKIQLILTRRDAVMYLILSVAARRALWRDSTISRGLEQRLVRSRSRPIRHFISPTRLMRAYVRLELFVIDAGDKETSKGSCLLQALSCYGILTTQCWRKIEYHIGISTQCSPLLFKEHLPTNASQPKTQP